MKPKTVKLLIEAIEECVYGPGGDPIVDTLLPAALIVKALKAEGFHHKVDTECIETLTGNNIEDANYLQDAGYPNYVDEGEEEEE